LGAPGASCSTAFSLAIMIANVLGTCVQLKLLNGDGLDPVHGLVAVAAARVMHRCRFVVIKKSRLAAAVAAGSATHAGRAPTAPDGVGNSSMDSESKIDSSWKLAIMWGRRVSSATGT
jgi:hypothetical protein